MRIEETVVSVEGLSFSYVGDIRALRGVSFQLRRGELLAVMGPNGAGKTTLCYILSGIIPNIYGGERRGRVRVFDFDPWDRPIYETAERCGIVLQDPETQLMMPDVRMELAFGPSNLGVPKAEIDRRIREALHIVGMEGYEERSPGELSGGEKQRIALAATLTMEPELLILDEPTSQLDPIGTSDVLAAIKRIKERGATVLMTTHKTEEVVDLADRVLILHEGVVAAYGSPREVLTQVGLLEKVGVKVPQVSRYFHSLREQGLKTGMPINLEEAVESLRDLIERGMVRVDSELDLRGRRGVRKGEPILEARDLTFVYPGPPEVVALRDVDITIHEGEFVGIVGQNGSGKTTLVKNLVGLLRPTKGAVFFKGRDTGEMSVGELSRSIGLILQNPDYQLFTISCWEEVAFGLRNIGVPKEEVEKRVMEALRLVGLEEEQDAFPFRLSFGDRRKLAVAAIVSMGPQVLIMDEPTTAQDHKGRYMLADLAKRLHDEMGRTIIMITHDMDLIARYADRLVVMKDGRIILDEPTREAFQKVELLEEAFLKPPQIMRLALALKDRGVPPGILTVEEMWKAVC
jgi:energy-coupling factor transport system ATP-binding protein